ncbi:MAG: lasso peptide biosynthesis B2 protein [Ramlibacter sp.]|nr:lasso peptide biosynthesis B2 protein [Ramlibacter sp.]
MKLSRLLSLNASQWWLVLTTAMLIPVYWLGVRSGVYRPTDWPLGAAGDARPLGEREEVVHIGALVNATARHMPWPVTCLVRSLVLVSQLRRRKIASRLRIGVRMAGGEFKAHAWVEHGAVPVNDRADIAQEFLPIDGALPGRAFSSP